MGDIMSETAIDPTGGSVALNGTERDETAQLAPAQAETEQAERTGTVLLVEDNKVNQLVGSKVLASLGYAYDIANNGREAVNAFQTSSYDAVLMDCQMPEMDGYQATGAIRRLEDVNETQRTPIIAMTAAAMEGDREACLAAGMDDFITKPVRLEIVSAVLKRWVAQNIPVSDEHELTVTASASGGKVS